MSGARLVVGIAVFGVIVPITLFFLLPLAPAAQFAVIAVTCFCCWCLADVGANILSRPRLHNRTPGDAFQSWDRRD